MISRSTIQHLRFPFSFFLMPVYLFALCISENVDLVRTVFSFLLIHLLIYPASNGYNSYFDRDEESIGGLKEPPPVRKDLYYTSLAMDGLAVVLAFWIHGQFALMLFVYGMVSKSYSHPSIRLKKMPVTGWITIGLFQGYFTMIMSYSAINSVYLPELMNKPMVHFAGLLSTALLLGSYPMTQIYQHGEDRRRNDITISIRLGILGTFHFTALFFTMAMGGFFFFFDFYFGKIYALLFILALTPVLVFFLIWYAKARKDLSKVNFQNTMRLNFISSLCMNVIFLLFAFFSF